MSQQRETDSHARPHSILGGLGTGDVYPRYLPTRVNTTLAHEFLQVSCSTTHSCALLTGGRVACFGSGTWGNLGQGTANIHNPFVPPALASGVAKVTAGSSFTCVLYVNASVACFGTNVGGTLGIGSNLTSLSLPTLVSALVPVGPIVDVVGSTTVACAVTYNGSIYCWVCRCCASREVARRTDRLTRSSLLRATTLTENSGWATSSSVVFPRSYPFTSPLHPRGTL